MPAEFWAKLDAAIRAVHSRGVAYVDSNKAENVLIGEDGRPYLIDFQIAWHCGQRTRHALGRWWLARLQREDLYHVLKHKRRFARHSMTSGELESVRRRSLLIRVHRAINHPYRMVRRPLLRWLRRTGRVDELVTEGDAGDGILKVAADQHVDVIVMGAHAGRAGLLGFGSTTHDVLRGAVCPVLSVKA